MQLCLATPTCILQPSTRGQPHLSTSVPVTLPVPASDIPKALRVPCPPFPGTMPILTAQRHTLLRLHLSALWAGSSCSHRGTASQCLTPGKEKQKEAEDQNSSCSCNAKAPPKQSLSTSHSLQPQNTGPSLSAAAGGWGRGAASSLPTSFSCGFTLKALAFSQRKGPWLVLAPDPAKGPCNSL